MTGKFSLIRLSALSLLLAGASHAPALAGERTKFNEGWMFAKGAQVDAESADFDDAAWREVTLPHDWSIEGPFDPKYNARTGGLPVHGEGWYRKTFTLPAESADKVISIEFDGAMANSTVYVNGVNVGSRPNGYVGFEYDISQHVHAGENIIAVQLEPNDWGSRWYAGSGLYRDVWLEVDEPVRFNERETVVTTPQISADSATVQIDAAIMMAEAAGGESLSLRLLDNGGNLVDEAVVRVAGEGATSHSFAVANPRLWDIDDPYLYRLEMAVMHEGREIDRMSLPVGFRTIEFTANDGMWLNGRRVPIQGVCLHHDNGPMGAVANRRAIQRKLEIMKAMGVNAIRTSHNMPSPVLVELADEMGLLVQVEAFDVWAMPKRGAHLGYNIHFDEWHERDLEAMVKDFRNHPSVFMWSLGNEIMEQARRDGEGARLTAQLGAIVKRYDTTRPTTAGFNNYGGSINNGLAAEVDLVGLNYKPDFYAQTKENYPDWIVYGSETSSSTSSRGSYDLSLTKYLKHPGRRVSGYGIIGPPWSYTPDYEWWHIAKTPAILGEFIWTGFDYLGEPTPYGGRDHNRDNYWNDDWPSRSSYFAPVDLAGLPKDNFYLYQSQWTTEPMVHLLPHWNWQGREGETVPVMAYTNGDSAELFLNGESLGVKVKGVDTVPLPMIERYAPGGIWESPYRLGWNVPYEEGTLRVVAYKDGEVIAEDIVVTSGMPAQIDLQPDRAVIASDGQDLSYITVTINDADGNFVPVAENLITFTVEGAGEIAAVGNGDQATVEPFQANYRRAYNGKAIVIIRGTGEPGPITVTAYSDHMRETTVELEAR